MPFLCCTWRFTFEDVAVSEVKRTPRCGPEGFRWSRHHNWGLDERTEFARTAKVMAALGH
jgi:hypothetical protein